MSYQSNYSGLQIDNGISLALAMYPVGSIYLSANNVNPGTIFGGTWVQIKDTFLLTAGDTYNAGSTGGAASHTHTSAAHTHTTAGHTLTVNEMPSHNHTAHSVRTGEASSGKVALRSIDLSNSSDTSIATPHVGSTGGGQAHSHGNTGSTTPGATGSSSNLPPYKVVYAWERTA